MIKLSPPTRTCAVKRAEVAMRQALARPSIAAGDHRNVFSSPALCRKNTSLQMSQHKMSWYNVMLRSRVWFAIEAAYSDA